MNTPKVIAEISGNHMQDLDRALKLVQIAKDAGADAVKLQTYTADTMTINVSNPDFIVTKGIWKGEKLYDLYKRAYTPWEWHPILFNKAKEIGITIFSTPFDESAVDYLEELDSPIYKISSFELTHYPLIAYAARTKKPLILSIGMGTLAEIEDAVETALINGCTDLTLLYCISAYPAQAKNFNLSTIQDLKSRFPKLRVGISDHSLGLTIPIAAVALGAEIIEKHITISRSDGSVDSAFSLEPSELKMLCDEVKIVSSAIGKPKYGVSTSEASNLIFKRSIYVINEIKKGEVFSKNNIKIIRPGHSLHPNQFEKVLGKISKHNLQPGERITTECIE